NSTTVNAGYLNISSDGVANSTTVNSGGSLYISSDGVANSTTVNSGGYLDIYSGGVANSITVNSGGNLYINFSGVAIDLTLSAGGRLGGFSFSEDKFFENIQNGSALISDNVYIVGNCMKISSGGTANSTTVNAGSLDIYSGGVANSTTVNAGYMYISCGGVANSTTVNAGYLDIYSGGVANSTTVNNDGHLDIYSGGVVSSTTVNAGYLDIYSGGTALEIKENGGYVWVDDGANVTFASNTISGLRLNADMTVHSNTVANSTTVNSRGYLAIYSGGVANSTTVNFSGYMYISSGGVANSTTVNSRGYLAIYSGGVANSTTLNYYGRMYISSGGTANSTTVNSDGCLDIYSGGVVSSTTVNPYGYLYISSGGTALNVKENGGYIFAAEGANVIFESNTITDLELAWGMTVHSNTIAENTTVNPVGTMYIYSGGVANSTTVNNGRMYIGGVANSTTGNSGGSMYISSGGVANSTTVNSWCSMYISSGGVANSTTVNAYGSMYISSGGVANSTTLNYYGRMSISSGGTASIVFNPWQGYVDSSAGAMVEYLERDANVYFGGWDKGLVSKADTMNGLWISAGLSAIIYSDGVANSTTVNDRAHLYIYSGGVANSTTVSSGGAIYLYDNSTLKQSVIEGNITIHSGSYTLNNNNFSNADFTIYDGAEIDLSGNYWGITDINAIYEKYGFSYSQVSISDVLLFDPTSLFSASMYGLTKNTFGEKTDALCVVFSHALDKTTISEKSFRLTDQNGNIVIIKDIDILGDRTVKLYIDTPAKEGRYHLYFADTIKNIGGMPLNNVNSENNEDGWADKITLKADYTAPYVTKVSPEYDFAGTLDTFSISFSEAIDSTSLNGKVSMIGPDGKVIAATLKTVANGTAYFTVAPQTAYGEYTIQISADFTDWTGHKLDQNRNGIGGEESDVFEHSFQITNVDLKVADVVLNKNTLAPGEKVVINWNTFNNGGYALSGSWTDGIYLSTDTRWDINDIKLGELTHEGGLAQDQQLANTLDVRLAAVAAGDYYILVRSDIYMQEKGDKESALLAQNLQAIGVTVSTPELKIGTAVDGTISDRGEYAVYKLYQDVNESVELVLDCHTDNANMEIYVGNGYVPSREKYDANAQKLTDGSLVIHGVDSARELYVMVWNRNTSAAFDYTLTAQPMPMTITGIAGITQGNKNGSVFELTGVNFAPDMIVALTDANGNVVNADKITFIDNSRARAEFNANSLAAGDYAISVNHNGELASYKEPITIVQDAEAEFNIKFISPKYVGWKSLTTLYVEYSNTGANSMDAPLVIVHPHLSDGREGAFLTLDESILTDGFWTSTKPAGFEYSVQMLASGKTPGILEADSTGKSVYKIPVYYASWQTPWPQDTITIDWGVSYIESSNTTTLDWNKFLADIGKTGKEAERLASNLATSVGTTWGDYVKMLNRNMRYLDENNISTDKVTVADLFSMEYRWASGDISYTPDLSINTDDTLKVGDWEFELNRNYYSDFDCRTGSSSFGNGWTCSWDMYLEIAENGDLTFIDGENRRLFQPNYSNGYNTVAHDGSNIKKLNNGTYKLTESDGTFRIFDSNGLLLSITAANEEEIVFEYADGKLCRIVSGYETRTITRNDSGLITAIVDQYGNTYNYSYDSNGNLITVTDDAGNVTAYTYAAEQLNGLSSITSGEEVSNFVYDATGRLTQWTVDGHTYKYDYGTTGMISISLDGELIGTNYYGMDGTLIKTIAADQVTRGNVVYGTLTDTDGNALAGITVNAVANDKVYSAVTDDNGVYRFTGIVDDRVEFIIQDARYKSSNEQQTLSGIDFTSINVEKATNSISGTYSFCDNLSTANILLTNNTTGEATFVQGYAGKFFAYDLAEGEYSMQIYSGNSATYYGSFTVTADSTYQNIGNYDLEAGGNIVYTLTSDSSLKNAVVQLVDGAGNVIAAELLSQGGTYTFENIAAGTYTLNVSSPLGENFNASKEITVDKLQNTETAIVLDDGVTISGTIRDANGNAQRGIYLELSHGETSYFVNTDYYGNYSFDSLVAGEYTLSVYGSNAPLESFTVNAGDADIIYNHTTEYFASWSGYLSDAEGMSVEGIVSLYLDGEYLDSVYATDGYFRFDMKKAGNYTIIAESDSGFFTQVESADIVSGSDEFSEFTLGTYSLTVDAASIPEGETTYILSLLDAADKAITYNVSTTADFTGLVAGKYRLTAYNGNFKAESEIFEVNGNGSQQITFEKLNDLKIQINELEEAINILLYNTNGEIVDSLRINETGIYTFNALGNANYKLVAFSDNYNSMQDVTVNADSGAVVLELTECTRKISGVITVDGQISEDICVFAYNQANELIGWTHTDIDGTYQLLLGNSETYKIAMGGSSTLFKQHEVTILDSQDFILNANLETISCASNAAEFPDEFQSFSWQDNISWGDYFLPAQWQSKVILQDCKEEMDKYVITENEWLTRPQTDMCSTCSNAWDRYYLVKERYQDTWIDTVTYKFDAVDDSIHEFMYNLGMLIASLATLHLTAVPAFFITGFTSLLDVWKICNNGLDDLINEIPTLDTLSNVISMANDTYGSMLERSLKEVSDEKIAELAKNNKTYQKYLEELLIEGISSDSAIPFEYLSKDAMAMVKERKKLEAALVKSKALDAFLSKLEAYLDAIDVLGSFREFQVNYEDLTNHIKVIKQYYELERHVRTQLPACPCDCDKKKNPAPPEAPNGQGVPSVPTNPVQSVDPNDKTVLEGYGEQGYIKGNETLNYKVEFENDPEFATAPARWIRVFDTLAPEYDLDTFVINSICLAGNYITVGNGRDSYNQLHEITVNGGEKVLVQIAINLDYDTREIFAEFTAIDPETGWMEQDVTTGILFPNDESGCGEGYFTYSIGLNEGVAHGTEITNKAEIYFDFNEVIETPTTVNTIDNVDPVFNGFTAVSNGGNQVTFTLNGSDADSGIKGYNISYSTDGKVFNYFTTVTGNSWTCEIDLQTEYFFKAQAIDNVGNVSDWSEAITVSQNKFIIPEKYTSGNFETIALNTVSGTLVITREGGAIRLPISSESADIAGLPAGTYQWESSDSNGNVTASGTLKGTASGADAFVSEANGKQDVFFARTNGKWTSDYAAQHNGNLVNNWSGTQEQVTLFGKNKIEDIFIGSKDSNILFLTDTSNGDAFFLDDIYTNGVTQSRISGIDKILAGAGDDVIDFTSSRYAYVGTGMEVYGGNGNDTIWMASGENAIFGDAGNDRIIGGAENDIIIGGIGNDSMHGGGGDDVFCFGENWGKDTVEQLANGKVTLWFESGSESNWNASTLTYTDGTNSVKVSGVTEVSLKFGGESPVTGAFLDAVSEKIFEDKNKGLLA
ncbi:MAG: AIDA repeat-containing protein, partial [Lentisphaeria bacterium]|nr:AIDA repeat-containing protein [Lentisphaeria bacterium]